MSSIPDHRWHMLACCPAELFWLPHGRPAGLGVTDGVDLPALHHCCSTCITALTASDLSNKRAEELWNLPGVPVTCDHMCINSLWLQVCQRPHIYSSDVAQAAAALLPFAVLWHLAAGMWMYSIIGETQALGG
jgi:hypothetical protein